jgi:hypothetical protein
LSAGEQPEGGALVAQGSVAVAGGDEVENQGSQRPRLDDRLAAEAQPNIVAIGFDVVEGGAADRGWPLSVMGLSRYLQSTRRVVVFSPASKPLGGPPRGLRA